jgi:hypothetical protein
MKKLFVILLSLIFASHAHAGLITYTVLSGDSGLSYTHLNSSFETIYDEFDGNIDSDNILDDSLKETDFADEINPRIRTQENIGDYTYTGMLPATATGLTSNISAGTSYVNGYRIVTAATSKTYTASKDTWVYIDQNGAFQYVEVATGGAQPTTPSNSLLLAMARTDGSDITAVTDHRQTTPPNLRIYADAKFGCVISRDISDADVINVTRGTIDFGSGVTNGLRRNISTIDIDFSTNGRGGLDTGSLAQGFYYIWAVPDDDNSTNFEGVASTSSSATSLAITGERLIGWCYAPTSSAISPDSVGAYRVLGGDAPNVVKREGNNNITTTATDATLMEDMLIQFYTSGGRPVRISWCGNIDMNANTEVYVALSIDGVGQGMTYYDDADNNASAMVIDTVVKLEAGTYAIDAKWWVGGNTATQPGLKSTRILTVEEL